MEQLASYLAQFLEYILSNSAKLKDLATSIPIFGTFFAFILGYMTKLLNLFKRKSTPEKFRSFSEDTDGLFVDNLCGKIVSAKNSIVFIGLGHTSLRHNDALKRQILATIRNTEGISLEIYYSALNDGLRNRLDDEIKFYAKKNKNYDSDWIVSFLENAVAYFDENLSVDQKYRVGIYRLTYMPMFYLIGVDDDYYFYMYGPPSIRGPESPWIHCTKGSAPKYMADFFEKNISFARANRSENHLTRALDRA